MFTNIDLQVRDPESEPISFTASFALFFFHMEPLRHLKCVTRISNTASCESAEFLGSAGIVGGQQSPLERLDASAGCELPQPHV
eukprot:6202592-Pleurochrysis_carterae.AAC.7